MDIVSTILSAAKSVGVSGTLLLAICSHESGSFQYNYAPMDHGTPSYGSCQLKADTAKMLGFSGNPIALNDPKINALYAAKFLKYQQDRYGEENWVQLASAYNAGSYLPSKRVPGCPKNLHYVQMVQMRLPLELQNKLQCGTFRKFAEE